MEEDASGAVRWKTWGPYLSDRQWGTVREDYGSDGNSWAHFTWEDSHTRAYRQGEDGLGGLCDYKQRLCFALALWNGQDPVLKERLFGLTNGEGNHGEDVKEYYFYLDNTPTHSYQKFLYKYPQSAFPYQKLRSVNAERGYQDFEYELLDTGIFDRNAYFDVFLEYAKASPDDILMQITVINRGHQEASLDVLPTLWYRNTWRGGDPRPQLVRQAGSVGVVHPDLPPLRLVCEGSPSLLFTENETGAKAAFHRHVIHGLPLAATAGTKAAFRVTWKLAPGESRVLRLRLSEGYLGEDFDDVMQTRRREADEFYRARLGTHLDEDQCNVARQALAGLLWTKQYYHFDVNAWIREHTQLHGEVARNSEWLHMHNEGIISVPDKWEYPWYAAWDLAFHAVALGMVDRRFAKRQLNLMLEEPYLHPSGQMPAYEWNFSDVNPPVHAWATAFLYFNEKYRTGHGDLHFLKTTFHKLLLNFTWWVNRKDRQGRNVFEGGFLGLDNIGLFDRSRPLPTGGHLEQADGTAWMCLYCQNMFEMAVELTYHDPSYQDLGRKFAEHFFHIASAMGRVGNVDDELWDEEDGFFYDVLRLPDGRGVRLKVRSMVGLLPMCAVSFVEPEIFERSAGLIERCQRRLRQFPDLVANIHDPLQPGVKGRFLLAVLTEERLRRVLERMLDPQTFFSDYGIRSLSRYHLEHPYVLHVDGETFRVDYSPAESQSGMFGGNSNWRGPIWFPMNMLIIRALLNYYSYYGDNFKISCAGRQMNLFEVAREIAQRLARIFLRDAKGRRPVFGGTEKFQQDPHWRDYLLFYEYFHGDNGAGLGASHQTGWTALVAPLMQWFAHNSAEDYLERGWADIAADARPQTRVLTRKRR